MTALMIPKKCGRHVLKTKALQKVKDPKMSRSPEGIQQEKTKLLKHTKPQKELSVHASRDELNSSGPVQHDENH